MNLQKLLSGGDRRSIGKSDAVVSMIQNQDDFDQLFSFLYSDERLHVMRAVDAVEKITAKHPQYLLKHKREVIDLSFAAINNELKWHLASLLARLRLSESEVYPVCELLSDWCLKDQSRIVRVSSLQALFEISSNWPVIRPKFMWILKRLEKENIPSLQSRIRKIKMKL